jgi:sortase A
MTAVVLPEDTYVLDDPGGPVLTLVTCYPFHYVGAAPKRFIVRAALVG